LGHFFSEYSVQLIRFFTYKWSNVSLVTVTLLYVSGDEAVEKPCRSQCCGSGIRYDKYPDPDLEYTNPDPHSEFKLAWLRDLLLDSD
jgi:hypothetical protein